MKIRVRHAALAVCLVTALGAGAGVARASTVDSGSTNPSLAGMRASSAARAVGISHPGQAFMGWSMKSGREHNATTAPRAGALAQRQGSGSPSSDLVPAPKGIDVSAWNPSVDWPSTYDNGYRFAYIKATEGNYYTSQTFNDQYTDSRAAGLVRGAYHFANPAVSTGPDQADYFIAHGGAWSADGWTLPGVLDIEYDPYGDDICYGLTPSAMTSWIAAFTKRYKARTGRDAVIYTTNGWWKQCTGDTTAFDKTNALWIAWYGTTPGQLPGGWKYHTFWQYSSKPIDQDSFNGTFNGLQKMVGAEPRCSRQPFPDVPVSSLFCWDITWLADQGITDGDQNGMFHPTTAVRRQEFAHFVYTIVAPGQADGPCASGQPSVFSDVRNTSPFCTSIRGLSRLGIINGDTKGRFHPSSPISRQEIAAMIYRAVQFDSGETSGADAPCALPIPFNDVTPTNLFCGDIEFMHDTGLSKGYTDGGYHPKAWTTRQEIAAFLYRYDHQIPTAPGTKSHSS